MKCSFFLLLLIGVVFFFYRGLLLQEQGRYNEALESYSTAIRYRKTLSIAYLNLAIVMTHLNQREHAKQIYRHCTQIDSTGLKNLRLHETTKISALYNLGRMYADEGNFEKALKTFQEAISRMPSYYPAQSLFNIIGEMHWKLNQSQEAEVWFRKSLRLKSDHIPVHLTYAKMLAKLNRTNEADQMYRKALLINSSDIIIYQHYGKNLC